MTTASEPLTTEHVAYEYRSITVDPRDEAQARDVYADFGWTVESAQRSRLGRGPVALQLRRDRNLKNRALVNELQRTAESSLGRVRALERSQTRIPTMITSGIGVLGAALLAGSVFAMSAALTPLMVLLGAGGLLLWCLTYPISRALRRSRRSTTVPTIERQRDVVEDCGRRSRALLA
jgi:hypothetical protein